MGSRRMSVYNILFTDSFRYQFRKRCRVTSNYSNNLEQFRQLREMLEARLPHRGLHELFKPIKKIGKSNFASVYLAVRMEDDKEFAIKVFSRKTAYGEDKDKEPLVNEIELMRKFYNKNLMRLFEVYEYDNSIYISVELLKEGQMYDKIKAKYKYKFSPEETISVIEDYLLAWNTHTRRVVHRNLKPENTLLRKEGDFDCVIADFGLVTWADEPEYLFVFYSTPGYVVPEIVNIKDNRAKCDLICDMFSTRVILHILVTGKSPFPGKTYNQACPRTVSATLISRLMNC